MQSEEGKMESYPLKNNDQIVVSQKQASIGAAFILMLTFFAFLAGYFCGSLSDSKAFALYDNDPVPVRSEMQHRSMQAGLLSPTIDKSLLQKSQPLESGQPTPKLISGSHQEAEQADQIQEKQESSDDTQESYVIEFKRCASNQEAQGIRDVLSNAAVTAYVVQRESWSVRGMRRYWYGVESDKVKNQEVRTLLRKLQPLVKKHGLAVEVTREKK